MEHPTGVVDNGSDGHVDTSHGNGHRLDELTTYTYSPWGHDKLASPGTQGSKYIDCLKNGLCCKVEERDSTLVVKTDTI